MRWLGTRTVEFCDIRVPRDWDERIAAARNGEFAAALKRTDGPIHLPVVDVASMEIIAGVDRLAALAKGGAQSAEVRMWSGSPTEARIVRASENLHRRDNQAGEWLPEYLDALEARRSEEGEFADDSSDNSGGQLPDATSGKSRGRGRPKSSRGEAREQAARELGTSAEAVRKREERAKRAAEPERVVEPAPKPKALERRIRDAAAEVEAVIARVDALVQAAEAWPEPKRLLSNAVDGRIGAMETDQGAGLARARRLLVLAAETVERAKAAVRAADMPSSQAPPPRTVGGRVAAGMGPKVGLGGRRLRTEDETPPEPIEDTEVLP